MPRIDFYDVNDGIYPSRDSGLYIVLSVAFFILIFASWLYGLATSDNKTKYVKNSFLESIGTIIYYFILGIAGVLCWFFGFLKYLLGLDPNADTEGPGGCILWFYRIIVFGGIILFLLSLLSSS